MWSVECKGLESGGVWSVECRVWSVKCAAESVECNV